MYKLLLGFLLLFPLQTQALTAADSGLKEAAAGTGLDRGIGLASWVNLILRGVLTLLATIFIVLIIFGGFKWMTSGGNAEKVKSAKQLITNSIIGLVIVVVSLSITYFVFDVLMGATGGGTGTYVEEY